MTRSLSKRRMAENEVVFRKMNEQAQEYIDELAAMADDDAHMSDMRHDDSALEFYCECSDEDCRLRIAIKPTVYTDLHERLDEFIIKPGHETNLIERVVAKNDGYWVVRKLDTPPQSATELQPTPVHNV